MNDPYETTEAHLERLLGRALNSFDLPDATVGRLDSALAHASSLHSSHHSAVLDRVTYRHAYLLSDGSSLVLWELVHSTGQGGAEQHELYTEESEARLAASRLPSGFPGFATTDGDSGSGAAGLSFSDLGADLDADFELLAALMTAPRPRSPGCTSRTTPRTTPAGSCAAPRTATGRARRPRGCCARRSRTTSRRSSAVSTGWTARTRASRCTSTRSCCSTAPRRACGRSSTRPPQTAATCARCTDRSTPRAKPWSCAHGALTGPFAQEFGAGRQAAARTLVSSSACAGACSGCALRSPLSRTTVAVLTSVPATMAAR